MVSSMMTGVAIGFLLFTIGAGLFVFYTQHAGKLGPGVHPDRVFAKFIIEELPAGLKGLLIAGLFAGSMSAISGVLNSLTTVLFTDFVHSRTKHKASVNSARAVTVSFGLICTAIAMFADRFGTILAATSKLTNFFGGTLVGIFLLGILVERANGRGAFLGALSGFTAVLALSALTTVSWMWYGAFSAVVAFTSGLLWSLPFPAPEAARLNGLTWFRRRARHVA
jgi:Na+/proline symporter